MKNYRFDENRKFSIKDFDCADTGEFRSRHEAIGEFIGNLEKINEYQQKLFAEQKEGIIFVFQAMDAAGKDGAVRAVLSCLSPQGVSEHSFKVPSAEENRHDYLWRFWSALPEKGSISIFNRSYYEDVLVQKIHRIYEKNRYADRIDRDSIIDNRYEQICSFEKYLWENSIRVVKIFLNVSKNEQALRFISRIDTPKKNWKFSSGDIEERAYWDDYMDAYETCINRTAKKNTPWYVVPADHKWYARLVISRIVLNELKNMNPQWPVLSDDEMNKLQSCRELLLSETDITEPECADDGEKIKPSDTAIGIALKNDRQALSAKKFGKLLEKSISENFGKRFEAEPGTKEKLEEVYTELEEAEASAESDDLDAVKEIYDRRKKALKNILNGRGKEARKLYEHFKKESKTQIKILTENIGCVYSQNEEDVQRYISEYENAVIKENADIADALAVCVSKMRESYGTLRASADGFRQKAEEALSEIAGRYMKISAAFETHAEQDEDAVTENNEDTFITEDIEDTDNLDVSVDSDESTDSDSE